MSESNTTPVEITLEAIEKIAADMLAGETAPRDRLLRLIKAYARILSVREPRLYKRMAVELADEDGHWDNSYPPDQEYKNFSGPSLLEIEDSDYSTVATESGFYHDWKAVTRDRGLFVSRAGEIYGCEFSGTGSFGQYAAYPGNCHVQVELEWSATDDDTLATSDLEKVERRLRDLTFPLTAEKGGK